MADEVEHKYLSFQKRQAVVDKHLADQIVLYLPFARGVSTLVTEEITRHLLTNLWVIEQFLGPMFQVTGDLGERGEISCRGRASP